MAPLVDGSGHAFAGWKLGLTAAGRGGADAAGPSARCSAGPWAYILYAVLGMYVVLVGYELFLLRNIPLD